MNAVYQKLLDCKEQIRKITNFEPEIAIVLGSGLGGFANKVKVEKTVNYSEINGFPVSTAPGHNGRFVFGYIGNKKVAVMDGRIHFYEGYDITDVVLPVRLLALLGAKTFILTNAAGGINRDFKPGTLMAITDHISFFVPSPLRGNNIDELGVRFPDMSSIYDKELTSILLDVAKNNQIDLKTGVYLQTSGPNYETPAEIRLAQAVGADAVGMSTAAEATALNHMGARICAVSCISNLAAGISKKPLTHAEVKQTAEMVSDQFQKLIYESILRM